MAPLLIFVLPIMIGLVSAYLAYSVAREYGLISALAVPLFGVFLVAPVLVFDLESSVPGMDQDMWPVLAFFGGAALLLLGILGAVIGKLVEWSLYRRALREDRNRARID